MRLNDFNFGDWINQWAGAWSILTISYWGDLYTKKLFLNEINQCMKHSIILWNHKKKSSAYWRLSEKKIFGRRINNLAASNTNFIPRICCKVRKAADHFFKVENKLYGKDISYRQYLKLLDIFLHDYYPYHILNKNGVDYFDDLLVKKYFTKIEETRAYITPALDRLEKFMVKLAEIHSKKTNYKPILILACVKDEFHDYLKGEKSLPSKKILRERYRGTVFLSKNGKTKIFTGNAIFKNVEAIISSSLKKDNLKGKVAYPGKIVGKVKIVLDPHKCKDFRQNDILVTGMTRPDYLPLMSKAAGFVTDSGGMLCHAAVTARETKKPCIVGTEIATKIFKDGDLIEVDANKGIIRKLKNRD